MEALDFDNHSHYSSWHTI